jgi:hypothetical protein
MATLAVYLAGLCDYSDTLVRGEKGLVLMIAPDVRQAKVLLEYAQGALESTPMLSQLIADRKRDELTLTNGIVLEVRSASFRRIRGATCVAVLADECCFWESEDSANPDTEILNAARPSLATTGGPLKRPWRRSVGGDQSIFFMNKLRELSFLLPVGDASWVFTKAQVLIPSQCRVRRG